MSTHFDLEIVTPERAVFSGRVESVTCPGVAGRFQVLARHAPFLSGLDTGLLTFVDDAGVEHRYAISGGVSQVSQNHMQVLAETAERSDEIDVQRAERARARAEERLHDRSADIDHERARAALLRAINRLKVSVPA